MRGACAGAIVTPVCVCFKIHVSSSRRHRSPDPSISCAEKTLVNDTDAHFLITPKACIQFIQCGEGGGTMGGLCACEERGVWDGGAVG